MANLIQFLNKTNTINAKIEIIVDDLLRDYNNGVIKTEVELMYRLKKAIKDFYYSVGRSTFKLKNAKGTPVYSDFSGMVSQACNDMKYIISECENVSGAISSSFVDSELGRAMLFNKIKYINKKLDEINHRIINNNGTNVVLYTDTFVNKEMSESISGNGSAYINTVDGVLTLGNTSSEILSKNSMVEVIEGSNGFPGTTHVVDILDNDIHFIGEQSLHMDLNEIVDNNTDTWFEYEMFNVSDNILEDCGNYGFEYNEGIAWAVDEESLKLKLKITLREAKECNWLSLTPFTPQNMGSKASFITKCTISDGESKAQEINQIKVFDDNTVIIFAPQVVSYIIIEFEQNIPYSTNIGHFYYTKANTVKTLAFDGLDDTTYSRVQGYNPSIELLNMKYDPSTKKYIHPKNFTDSSDDLYIDEVYIRKQLFKLPNDTEKVKANKEKLSAYRYCIGIKNISVAKYNFAKDSVYISKTFNTNDIVTSISLESDELIPNEFLYYGIDKNGNQLYDGETKFSNASDWIKYELSFNGGVNWSEIFPKHRAFQGPCVYKINSQLQRSLRNANVKYIDKLTDINSVKLKITLSRPAGSDMESKTPVVYQYKLKVTTGGESIEY